MLVTNYNQYHDLKSKDSEELMQSPGLLKKIKLRKYKSSITEYKKLLVKIYLFLH